MNIAPKPKLAVTDRISAALGYGCASWSLQLDKLSFERRGEAAAKTERLRSVLAAYDRLSKEHLRKVCEAKLQWVGTLQAQIGPTRFRRVDLVNESRLLIHLGRASVLENVGLCTERITGLPWIPGTALKGVLSTWAYWEGYFSRH